MDLYRCGIVLLGAFLCHCDILLLGITCTIVGCFFYDLELPKKSHITSCPNNVTLAHSSMVENNSGVIMKASWRTRYIIFPKSLLHALRAVTNARVKSRSECLPILEDLTTLDIHVITSSRIHKASSNPLFNSDIWELIMHHLPKLKHLNLVFIRQGADSGKSSDIDTSIFLCKECRDHNRVMKYSVKPMYYHMYFSSQEYTVPNAVVIYGGSVMTSTEKGKPDIHSEISYRNMTYSRDTVLVLIDSTMDLVKKRVKAVNAVRPVEQLVPPNRWPRGPSVRASMAPAHLTF